MESSESAASRSASDPASGIGLKTLVVEKRPFLISLYRLSREVFDDLGNPWHGHSVRHTVLLDPRRPMWWKWVSNHLMAFTEEPPEEPH